MFGREFFVCGLYVRKQSQSQFLTTSWSWRVQRPHRQRRSHGARRNTKVMSSSRVFANGNVRNARGWRVAHDAHAPSQSMMIFDDVSSRATRCAHMLHCGINTTCHDFSQYRCRFVTHDGKNEARMIMQIKRTDAPTLCSLRVLTFAEGTFHRRPIRW